MKKNTTRPTGPEGNVERVKRKPSPALRGRRPGWTSATTEELLLHLDKQARCQAGAVATTRPV